MEFWRTILALLRRKSVTLPVLLVTLGVTGAAYLALPTQYMSTATIVLATSPNGGTLVQDPTRPTQQINPLRNFDGMRTAAAILIQVLSTPDVADQLGAGPGSATTFTVTDASAVPRLLGSNGPFVVIEGHSTSAAAAHDIVVRVEQRLRDELINLQQAINAPQSTFISMIDVVRPTAPEAQLGAKLQTVGGALVLSLLASIGVAYLVHRIRETAVSDAPAPDTVAAQRVEEFTTPAVSISSVLAGSNGTLGRHARRNPDGPGH